MLGRVRAVGPVLLVPLAWTFAALAHRGSLQVRTVLIGHLVMATLLVAFAVLSRGDMAEGVLRVWWVVVAAGVPVTLLGVWALSRPAPPLLPLRVTVLGWMVLPAGALAHTAAQVRRAGDAYATGAVLSGLGALVYVLDAAAQTPPLGLAGIALVGLGQTVGIVAAVRYHRPAWR